MHCTPFQADGGQCPPYGCHADESAIAALFSACGAGGGRGRGGGLRAAGIDARANDDSPLPIDPQALQQQIETLDGAKAAFLERAIQGVLKSHGTRRTMPSGLERTRYLLTRLTQRPMYYLWRHPTLEVTWP